ncbi:hypothetical protein [Sphingomonas sp.]|jgi:hypothetical protein
MPGVAIRGARTIADFAWRVLIWGKRRRNDRPITVIDIIGNLP